MSRIGRLPITIPDKVQVSLSGQRITVKGPKGSLQWQAPEAIRVKVEGGHVSLARPDDERQSRALHGLTRALIANMVRGVSTGFNKVLEVLGTGYRASLQGKVLQLDVGYSYPVRFEIPQGIEISVDRNNVITVSGIDKQLVGETAARIRKVRPPEPYKGKGIRYRDEYVRRKVGKKNV